MKNRGFFDTTVGIVYSYENSQGDRDLWKTTNEFKYYIGPIGDAKYVIVPKGFITDGASVPRMFWSIFPPWGRYGQAAVLHDHLCSTLKLSSNGDSEDLKLSQKDVDVIFLNAMVCLEVPLWKRRLIYYCVRFYSEVTSNL